MIALMGVKPGSNFAERMMQNAKMRAAMLQMTFSGPYFKSGKDGWNIKKGKQ